MLRMREYLRNIISSTYVNFNYFMQNHFVGA
jgi:hypothetical protein